MNRAAAALLACLVAASACSKKQDTIIEASDRVTVSPEDIDRDPLALLPGNAIGVTRIDAPSFFQAQFGQRLRALVEARVPLPPSAGFDPARDLRTLYVGNYSMQGADVAVVVTGTFHPDAIERAADGTTMTPLGAPLVKTSYAKRTLYVSRNVGFVVLTEHTVLAGNETGIRRALDRMSEGRMKHEVPGWIEEVLNTPNAPLAAAFDFAGQPPVQATMRGMSFLDGMKTARIVGNFQPPGMNFAGTLTYPDEQKAQAGAAGLLGVNRQISSYSFFMSLAGIKNPIQKLDAVAQGKDAQFVVALEQTAVEWLIGQAANQLGAPGQTVPATTSPARTYP